MFKKTALLLVLPLLVSVLAACGGKETVDTRILTAEKKQALAESWYEMEGHEMGELKDWDTMKASSGAWSGLRYYGCFDGCDIVFIEGQLQALSGFEIEDAEFRHSTSFVIYAYQDGKFYQLEDAYEKGLIGLEAVKELAGIHEEWEAEF